MFDFWTLGFVSCVALAFIVFLWSFESEGRWYRKQRRRMELSRSGLADEGFLNSVQAAPGEGPLWLAVRRAVADSIGLPAEAIQPQDRLADLWRMQCLGPDIMDIVFRLERILAVRIDRHSISKFAGGLHYGQAGEFREFAEAVVQGLCEATHQESG